MRTIKESILGSTNTGIRSVKGHHNIFDSDEPVCKLLREMLKFYAEDYPNPELRGMSEDEKYVLIPYISKFQQKDNILLYDNVVFMAVQSTARHTSGPQSYKEEKRTEKFANKCAEEFGNVFGKDRVKTKQIQKASSGWPAQFLIYAVI